MHSLDRLASGVALLTGLAWMVIASGALITQPNQANDGNGSGGRLSGLLARVIPHGPDAPDAVGGAYGGYTTAHNSDVILQQPNGTDMVLKDISWNSEPEKMPPYHGFRGTWWTPFAQSLGVMADLVYIKVVADRARTVRQSGMRDGVAVPDREPASATFRRLEFTDGLNLLTGNLVYRLPFWGRVRPYIGIGAGLSLPHAEVKRSGASQKTSSYQFAGFAFQIIAGIEYRVATRGAVFTEYRLSYATNDVRLIDGGRLQTNLLVNHYTAGGSGYLRPVP